MRWVVWGLNKSTKNTTFFNLFHFGILGYLFIIQTKKLFFRLLFCTLVHMVYIASPALHRSKRSGLVKCHSRRRVCIVCGGKCRILQLNKSTKNTTFFNLFYYRVLGYLFIIQTKKLFFRLLFCTLVHMVYIASPALHRSKRSGLVKCHSRRRVCIVCGGKWVEWDVTSGG